MKQSRRALLDLQFDLPIRNVRETDATPRLKSFARLARSFRRRKAVFGSVFPRGQACFSILCRRTVEMTQGRAWDKLPKKPTHPAIFS
jgi:hypothetical protein